MPEGAVYVGRPTAYGNPFPPGRTIYVTNSKEEVHRMIADIDLSLLLYRAWFYEHSLDWLRECTEKLKGKDLACWCKPRSKCHADFLLEYANK
jgi:hypothetical protein